MNNKVVKYTNDVTVAYYIGGYHVVLIEGNKETIL
jgi:hypothetical protein